jgi:hypothetical protein
MSEGNQTLNGNKTLSGSTTLGGPVTVTGTTTLNGATTMNGATTHNGATTFTGSTTLTTVRGAGANKFAGSYELAPGATSATVPHTGIQLNSTVILTYEDLNGQAFLSAFISGKNPGVSFTAMLSGPVPDGSNARLHYMIINP